MTKEMKGLAKKAERLIKKTEVFSFSLLAEKTLPFRLRWGIAENGWDKKSFEKKNMKII